MPDTDTTTQTTPPQATPPPHKPADDAKYVTLARPQAHAVFQEQRTEFKGDEVKTVVKKSDVVDPKDRHKTILTDPAAELVKAGRLVYCDAKGKPLESAKENDK